MFYAPDYKSQIFFDGRIMKMTSVLASMATLKFNQLVQFVLPAYVDRNPIFDCRVWQVPNQEEACNVLFWRELDASKNSVSSAAQVHYSHKELFGQGQADQHEMLHAKGVNWNDFPSFFKRGTYFQRRRILRAFTTEELDKLPPKHEARRNPLLEVERHEVTPIALPPFSKILNKTDVVFEGAQPEILSADGKPTLEISEWIK